MIHKSLNKTINHLNLIDIDRQYPTTPEYIFFSSPHGNLQDRLYSWQNNQFQKILNIEFQFVF